MDAQYLKKNINDALVEALASMAISLPEDGVEYIGKYLIQYVDRQEQHKNILKKNDEIEALAKQVRDSELLKEVAAVERESKQRDNDSKLKSFVDSLFPLSQNKQDVMSRVTQFLADYLDIPAVYIGVIKSLGETEAINYCSANVGQEHCIGKRIIKQLDESEEVPSRQGLSFEAFKVPELPETEEEELAEGEEPKPRPVPKPTPMHIENVLRNPRIKFFGIPKLGAYVAIPLEYSSLDHENSCHLQVNEESGESRYLPQPLPQKMIIGMDTIGKYRRFTQFDIKIAQVVGDAMVNALKLMEEKMYDNNVQCLNTLKPLLPPVTESLDGLKSGEEEAVSTAMSELTEEERAEQGPIKDSITRAAYWTQQIINVPISNGYNSLRDHVLPVPAMYLTLFYCVGCLIGIPPSSMRDPCGDLSWDAIKKTTLSSLITGAFTYDVTQTVSVTSESCVSTIRSLCESSAIFDHSLYLNHFVGLIPISIWLQKNLTAREQAIGYYKDQRNENLEIIIKN